MDALEYMVTATYGRAQLSHEPEAWAHLRREIVRVIESGSGEPSLGRYVFATPTGEHWTVSEVIE